MTGRPARTASALVDPCPGELVDLARVTPAEFSKMSPDERRYAIVLRPEPLPTTPGEWAAFYEALRLDEARGK